MVSNLHQKLIKINSNAGQISNFFVFSKHPNILKTNFTSSNIDFKSSSHDVTLKL
jgi:hypothetical protein